MKIFSVKASVSSNSKALLISLDRQNTPTDCQGKLWSFDSVLGKCCADLFSNKF